MLLAIIRANNSQKDSLRAHRLRRALVLALANAGVTDIVWERIGRDEVVPPFAWLAPCLPDFHFTAVPCPCSGRTLIIEESETFYEPAAFQLLLSWPGDASIEATHNGMPVGLWARSASKYSNEISVEIPDQHIFFLRDRVLV
ncbi:MAG: hypothetical protein HY646_15685 [Acidobacteria bacterium]|nr:hypothetical protein [Acidobacteriota bacterium]